MPGAYGGQPGQPGIPGAYARQPGMPGAAAGQPGAYGGQPGQPGMPGAYGGQPGAYGGQPDAYGGPPEQSGMARSPAVVSAGVLGNSGGGLFPQKSPVAVFFLWMFTCGIYSLFWFKGTADAMERRGEQIGPFWHVFIPILGLLWVWKWCQGLEKVCGPEFSAGMNLLKIWFLGGVGMAWLQSDFNKMA